MSEIYLVGGTTPRTDLDNYVSANINKENAIKSLEYWKKEQREYDDFHIDHIEIDDLAEHDAKIRAEVVGECMTILKSHHMFRTCEDDYNPKIERPFYQNLWNRFKQLKEQSDGM